MAVFEEHFTIEEQETLVGLIIGQTGAEVFEGHARLGSPVAR